MRVLYVLHEFFPRFYGGTERYVLNLAHQMQRMGHHVEVLAYGLMEPDEALPATVGGMAARSYVYDGIPVTLLRHRSSPSSLDLRIGDAEVAKGVAAVLDHGSHDIVHVAHPMRLAGIGEAVRRAGIPLVLTLTDFWLLCPRSRFFKPDLSPCNSPEGGEKCVRECGIEPLVRDRYARARALFESADAVIAPSQFVIEVFRRCGWERAIHRIRHGVEVSRPTVPAIRRNGAINVGYTGVVAPFKGIGLLIAAFSATRAPQMALKIYGNILYEQRFRDEIAHAFGLDPRIKLMNAYDHDALPEVMADIDVMVVPSTTLDSYGLVVAESLAFGVPVIASDMVGSAHELIRDGENGFIFPSGDSGRLRELLERIAREPDLLPRLRHAITSPPRIEGEAFQVEQVYRSLCAPGRADGSRLS